MSSKPIARLSAVESRRYAALQAELAETKAALREAEDKLAAIHDHHYQLTGLVGLDGTLLMANKTALAMIGAAAEDVIGDPFWDTPWWTHDEALQAALHDAVAAGAKGNSSHIEATHQTSDGDVRFIDFRLIPIFGECGDVRWLKAEGVDVTEHKRTQRALERALQDWRSATDATVAAISAAVESRDPYTAGHQRRVAAIAKAIAEKLELDDERVRCVYYAGLVHDIGKIAVPAEILNSPGHLSEEAMGLMRLHARTGHEILCHGNFPWPLAQVTLEHHERLDGSGYPNGLKGDEISLEARILGVADVVEAMSTHRPYRAALGLRAALEELEANKDVRYDSSVVDALQTLVAQGEISL